MGWGRSRAPHRLCLLLALLMPLTGCVTGTERHAPTTAEHNPEEFVPTELCKVSLPPYRIAPPDILSIEAVRIVPKPPYRIQPLDLLSIQVPPTQTLPDQPIANTFQVSASGTVTLGPAYGSVSVEGMTLDEATEAIKTFLEDNALRVADVALALAQPAGKQQITGEHLVSPDGRINLGVYGSVYVTGMSIPEVKAAIEDFLSEHLEDPEISVKVSSYNSQYYYVITQGLGNQQGDGLDKIAVTGNETVLDALSQIRGLQPFSSKRVWIARPAPDGLGYDQILQVDWNAISQGGSTATNFQVLPNDRIYIQENKLLAFANFVNTATQPFENIFGFASLGINQVQLINRLPNGVRGLQNPFNAGLF